MKPIILVLEDMEIRVVWLRTIFGDHVEIVWTTNVADFITTQARVAPDRVCLIIMDHDLHLPGHAVVPSGLVAARTMTLVAPVIVWSQNPEGAPSMRDELKRRGYTAEWAPYFERELPTMAGKILHRVLSWRKNRRPD